MRLDYTFERQIELEKRDSYDDGYMCGDAAGHARGRVEGCVEGYSNGMTANVKQLISYLPKFFHDQLSVTDMD